MNQHRLDEEMLENKNFLRDRTQDGNFSTGRGQCDSFCYYIWNETLFLSIRRVSTKLLLLLHSDSTLQLLLLYNDALLGGATLYSVLSLVLLHSDCALWQRMYICFIFTSIQIFIEIFFLNSY